MKYPGLLLAGLLLTGCATVPPGKADPRDPWERFNRSSFAFNDALDRAVAKPAAKAYKKITPRIVRTGVSNFVSNLDTLTTVFNDILQGKMKQAGQDTGRFLLNTTLGLGGLFDPATAAGLANNDEDFGQTLGKWGVKSGPYLMLPILGPSTVRDAFGRIPDQFTYPINYVSDTNVRYGVRVLSFLDLRAGLLDLDPQLEQSFDRYAFVREAWLKRREFVVSDGKVTSQPVEFEEYPEEPVDGAPVDGTATPPDAAAAPAPAPADGANPPPAGANPPPQ